MVFLTCIIVVLILYYLQAEGLIYVTVIAVVAEMINLFMTQTLTKSVEKKSADKYGKVISRQKTVIDSQVKTIKGLKKIRDDAVQKLYQANTAIKTYEDQLGVEKNQSLEIPSGSDGEKPPK